MGGFYTLLIGISFVLSSRITKLANRGYAFHRKQGILPSFSLSHRNAEELSALRTFVLAAFGITEDEYFSTNFKKSLTMVIENISNR
jgi:hypothetical protein